MPTQDFRLILRQWRRSSGISQQALAHVLGVSQAAVSRWENGIDAPTGPQLARLTDLISAGITDDLVADRLFIDNLSGMHALFDLDGIRIAGTSLGLRSAWPDFSRIATPLADHLIAETRAIIDDTSLRREVLSGDVALVSGVTLRHTDFALDTELKHRWSARFRRYGHRVIAHMAYEPCAPDVPFGIDRVLRLDALPRD